MLESSHNRKNNFELPFTTLEGHFTWIGSNHLRKHRESTLERLRLAIHACGVHQDKEAVVTATSEKATKRFFNEIGKLCKLQRVGNGCLSRDSDMDLDCQKPLAIPSTDVLSTLNDVDSLSVNFGRFSMSAKGPSRGKDVFIEVKILEDLTSDDIEFIQQSHPERLNILCTLVGG